MAKQCPICQRKYLWVWKRMKLRGKYNPTLKRKQKLNLQWAFIPKDIKKEPYKKFAGKRIKICTKCIKTMEKGK